MQIRPGLAQVPTMVDVLVAVGAVLLVGEGCGRFEADLLGAGLQPLWVANATDAVARLKGGSFPFVVVGGSVPEMPLSGVAEGVLRHFDHSSVVLCGDIDMGLAGQFLATGRLMIFPPTVTTTVVVDHIAQRLPRRASASAIPAFGAPPPFAGFSVASSAPPVFAPPVSAPAAAPAMSFAFPPTGAGPFSQPSFAPPSFPASSFPPGAPSGGSFPPNPNSSLPPFLAMGAGSMSLPGGNDLAAGFAAAFAAAAPSLPPEPSATAALQHRIQLLEEGRFDAAAREAELEGQLQATRLELDQAHRALAEPRIAPEVMAEIELLRRQAAEAREEGHRLREDVMRASQRMQELQASADQHELELERSRQELERLGHEQGNLANQLEDAKATGYTQGLAVGDREAREEQREEMALLQKGNDELQAALAAERGQRNVDNDQLAGLHDRYAAQMQEQLAQLRTQADEHIAGQTQRLQLQLEEHLQQQQLSIEASWGERAHALEAELQQQRAALADERADRAQFDASIIELAQERERLVSRVTELEQIAAATAGPTDGERNAQAALHGLQAELEPIRQRRDQLELALQANVKRREEMQGEIETLEERTQSLAQELFRVQQRNQSDSGRPAAELDALRAHITSLEEQVANLEAQAALEMDGPPPSLELERAAVELAAAHHVLVNVHEYLLENTFGMAGAEQQVEQLQGVVAIVQRIANEHKPH